MPQGNPAHHVARRHDARDHEARSLLDVPPLTPTDTIDEPDHGEGFDLATCIENATLAIERMRPALVDGSMTFREGQVLCTWFRQRAVARYLHEDDAQSFVADMMRSAAAFLRVLETCDEDSKITSQARPFFDALCGGDIEVAKKIGALSRATRNTAYEHESELGYVRFLMALVNGEEPLVPVDSDETRHRVCASLASRNTRQLGIHLESLSVARVARLETLHDRLGIPDEQYAWMKDFSSEGMALLRIALARGMSPARSILHVPDELRQLTPPPFDPECWRQ